MGVYISRIWGEETPKPIWIKFGIVVDVPDVITQTKFGDNRLRSSGVVAGQISAFPSDFAGRPYNTLTLPCESVITILVWQTDSNINLYFGITVQHTVILKSYLLSTARQFMHKI